ncbi:MAG: DUF2142 domain-containing protein [Chloroflexi bacterium]|nr:DUF2142 domain-containing protein [Chloroflexota bacterium]MBI3340249.1 DUF2142 domain-containing protein [Chloroflexota bacterium]
MALTIGIPELCKKDEMGINLFKDKKFSVHFEPAEIFVIVVLLILGGIAALFVPLSAGYDEETHLIRVWQMSDFSFVPNQADAKIPFPAVYWDLSYRRQLLVRVAEPDFWAKYGGLRIDAHDYIYAGVETRSVYSPPLLLPQALVMRFLGRSLQLPALFVFYAIRFSGLLSYLILAWLAVRLIPAHKWLLAVLAVSPMALFQAATISADSISNGIALLFIGGTLAVAAREELGWKEWGTLAVLFFILFFGKVNIVPLALLPFFLINPSRFKMRHGYLTLAVAAILMLVVEVGGWNFIAYSRYTAALTVDGADPVGQIRFILTNPLGYSKIVALNAVQHGADYLRAWIAIYGFDYWPVPKITYYLYAAGLLAALAAGPGQAGFGKRARISLASVFVLTYLATVTSLYISYTAVGSADIQGIQGRYFIPVMPLILLALADWSALQRLRLPARIASSLALVAVASYVIGLIIVYHVPCGAQFFESGLCYQPVYKNWSPDARYSPPISATTSLIQEIVPECDDLTEVRVWVNSSAADGKAMTEFQVKDTVDDFYVADQYVLNNKLPQGGWYSLKFQPDRSSSGKLYLLTIRSNSPGRGPEIGYTLKPEYKLGKLFENGEAAQQDLVFQIGCIAGWEKLKLAGRP